MRCASCNRPLMRAAWQVRTKAGMLAFGPKCAKRFVVRPTRTKHVVMDRVRCDDPAQMVMEFA